MTHLQHKDHAYGTQLFFILSRVKLPCGEEMMKMTLARMFLAVFLAVALSQPAFAGRSAFSWPWSKPAKQSFRGPQTVPFRSGEAPGTIIIETRKHRLYLVQPGGKAILYPVGVGRDGHAWSG